MPHPTWQPATKLDPDYNRLEARRERDAAHTDRDMLTVALHRLDKALAERDQVLTRLDDALERLREHELTQLHINQLERLLRDARQQLAEQDRDRPSETKGASV